MGKSKVTIKEIADMAGVSIATVSHVINRTRYVRPELVDKIEKIIVETGYQNKIADKERKLLVGRESTIVAVIPNIESTIYRDMVAYVKRLVMFTAVCTAVLDLFRHKFMLYGFTISYWDVLIWSLVAGIVISFIKGLLTGDE